MQRESRYVVVNVGTCFLLAAVLPASNWLGQVRAEHYISYMFSIFVYICHEAGF